MKWIQIPLALVTIVPLATAQAEVPGANHERSIDREDIDNRAESAAGKAHCFQEERQAQVIDSSSSDRLKEVLVHFSTTPIRVKARENCTDLDEHVDCCGAAG